MTDHVEMLHLLALDARRVDDQLRAKVLFDAAEYLNFLDAIGSGHAARDDYPPDFENRRVGDRASIPAIKTGSSISSSSS
jgi:hypothetical protein